MKKVIAVALIALMVIGLCACSINDTEVSILWSGANDHAIVPDSLINAMYRAMYIENISYKHYAAAGDQAKQTKQAEECLNAGCAALMVELVDSSAAQTIVDLAKAKNVPVVFFGCDVDEAVVNSYDKCVAITTDAARLYEAYSAMLYSYFAPTMKKQNEAKEKGKEEAGWDKDGDGVITYLALCDMRITVPNEDMIKTYELDKKLYTDFSFAPVSGTLQDLKVQTKTEEKTAFFFFKSVEESAYLTTADGKIVEAIFTDNDQQALELLVDLQKLGLNADKLSTHYVPVFTVGADADYKAFVMQDLPADAEARKAHLEAMIQLVDMTGISAEEWEKRAKGEKNEVDDMIYNTLNQVAAGKLSGNAMEDYDAIAIAAAEAVASLIKGETVEETVVKLPFAFTVAG